MYMYTKQILQPNISTVKFHSKQSQTQCMLLFSLTPCQQIRYIATHGFEGGVGLGGPCGGNLASHHVVKHILQLRGHHHQPLY